MCGNFLSAMAAATVWLTRMDLVSAQYGFNQGVGLPHIHHPGGFFYQEVGLPHMHHPGGFHHGVGVHDPFDPFMYDPGFYAQPRPERVEDHYPDARPPPQQQVKPLFSSKSPVKVLSGTNFPDDESKHLWLVMHHDGGGKLSVAAKPAIEKLAEKLNRKLKFNFRVGEFDCRNDQSFCRTRVGSLADLPRFAFVVDGKLEVMDDDTYQGVVSSTTLYSFSVDQMPRHLISNINGQQHLERFQSKIRAKKTTRQKKGAVLLFTDKFETSTLFYSLAYKYRQDLLFAENRGENRELLAEVVQQNGLRHDFPTLVA
jgi:hypothetical protein